MTVIIAEQLQIQNLQCIVFHLKNSRLLLSSRTVSAETNVRCEDKLCGKALSPNPSLSYCVK